MEAHDGGLTEEETKAVHAELVRKWKALMTEDRSRSVMVDNSPAGTATRVALAAQAKSPAGGISQTDLTYSAVAMADGGIPICGQGAQLLPQIEQANASAKAKAQAEAQAKAASGKAQSASAASAASSKQSSAGSAGEGAGEKEQGQGQEAMSDDGGEAAPAPAPAP